MKEAGPSSTGPIGIFVVVNSWAAVKEAEENVVGWPDYNSGVSAPYHQIARFRDSYSLEAFGSFVKIGGTRVAVIEAGSLVDAMHQMGTVALGRKSDSRIKRRGNH